MAAGAWQIYNRFKFWLGNEVIDMDSDAFVVALFTSASNAGTLTNQLLGDLTNENSGSGYARDTTNTVTWTETGGIATFDITTDPVYTASGSNLVSRFGVIYDDTPSSPLDPLVCVCLLDATPADVTITPGNTLTIQISATGVFTLQ